MDGVHDLGGMQGFGAIDPEPGGGGAGVPRRVGGPGARPDAGRRRAGALDSRHVAPCAGAAAPRSSISPTATTRPGSTRWRSCCWRRVSSRRRNWPAAGPPLRGTRTSRAGACRRSGWRRSWPGAIRPSSPPTSRPPSPRATGSGCGSCTRTAIAAPRAMSAAGPHDRPLPWRPRAAGRKRPRSQGRRSALHRPVRGGGAVGSRCRRPRRGPCGSLATLSGAGMTTMPNPDDARAGSARSPSPGRRRPSPWRPRWSRRAWCRGRTGPRRWARRSAAILPCRGKRQARPTGDRWLAALDRLLAGARPGRAVRRRRERTDAWRDAYLRTPHGQPVDLEKGRRQAGR